MSIRNKNMTAWKPKSVRLILFNHLIYFSFYKKGKNVSLFWSLSVTKNNMTLSVFKCQLLWICHWLHQNQGLSYSHVTGQCSCICPSIFLLIVYPGTLFINFKKFLSHGARCTNKHTRGGWQNTHLTWMHAGWKGIALLQFLTFPHVISLQPKKTTKKEIPYDPTVPLLGI